MSIRIQTELELSTLSLVKKLSPHISKRRRIQIALVLFLMIVSAFAEIVSIGAVLPFLGVLTAPEKFLSSEYFVALKILVGISKPEEFLWVLTAAFCFVAVFAGAIRFALLWTQTKLGFLIGGDIGAAALSRVLHQPYSVHLSQNSATVVATITVKIRDVINQILVPIMSLIASAIMITTVLIIFVIVDSSIALFCAISFGSIYACATILVKKQLVKDGKIVAEKQNEVISALQNGLFGIRDVLLDGAQQLHCDVFRKIDQPLRRSSANIIILSQAPRYIIEAAGIVMFALIGYFLLSKHGSSFLIVPTLGAIALGAQRMLPLLQQGYWSVSQLLGGKGALSDVVRLLELPLPAPKVKDVQIAFRNNICLHDVYFQYSSAKSPAISGVSLSFPKGFRVGIIGSTGSGKSTLIDLLMGLLQPATGKITIDGVALNDVNTQAWQALIAHVPQMIYLSDSTIAENIGFGLPIEAIDMQRVRKACEQARIADHIESLPSKYLTLVGERGLQLSGGQRQRLGIARAFYKRAEVLFFDEATSALDGDTESSVMSSINSLGRELTVFIIAHRRTTLMGCDLIIEIEGGRVARAGSFKDVIGIDC